jgi:predicted GNAT family N-acyltransferase
MAEFDLRRVDGTATLEDAHEVRREVFIEGQDVAETEEMDGLDDEAWHLVAYDGDVPVGTARLREPDPGVAKVERVAVREHYRGQGLGRALMHELEDLASEQGLTEAVLHAQTHVESFYVDLGYETTSDVFEEAGIPHVEMRKHLVRDSWTC